MLDRLDLQVGVPALAARELQSAASCESSDAVRTRVLAARERSCLNATLPPARLRECRALDTPGCRLVTDAVDRGGMSARAVHRAVRVAHTIANPKGEERIDAYEGREGSAS